MANAFPVSQDLTQILGSQNVSQGGLSKQMSGAIGILHICNRCRGIIDSEVHHSINFHSHTVFGQNLQKLKRQVLDTLKP